MFLIFNIFTRNHGDDTSPLLPKILSPNSYFKNLIALEIEWKPGVQTNTCHRAGVKQWLSAGVKSILRGHVESRNVRLAGSEASLISKVTK